MEKLRKSKPRKLRSSAIVLSLIVLAASVAVTIPVRSSYAQSSTPSASPATDATPTVPAGLVAACAEAVEELRASRKLLASQGELIERQDEMLKLEGEIATLAKRVNDLSQKEIAQLRVALAAKDRVIAATEAEVAVLKKQRMTVWKKIKWFVYGGAVGVAAGAVLIGR